MFIGEIEEIGVIEPVSMPETEPVSEPVAPVEEPVPAR
jgi:hypothetical protein